MTGIFLPIEGVTYCDPTLAATYIARGAWVDMTVGEALSRTAARVPEKPAFITDEGSLNFKDLHDTTDRLAAALVEIGLMPGDRAMFQMGTTLETAIALIASYKAGIIPVCSVPQFRDVEIGTLTQLSGARGYFVQGDFGSFDLVEFGQRMIATHETLSILIVARRGSSAGGHDLKALIDAMPLDCARERLSRIEIGAQDVLSYQLSGGTTGMPKIIPRFHAEYLGHSLHCMPRFGMSGDSRLIWTLPLLHNAGQLYSLISVLQTGMSAVLMSRVDVKRMMELIEIHRVTHAISIGPIAPQIIAYPDVKAHDLSSLQMFGTMSRADLLEAHLGVPCGNLYGITEGLLLCTPPGEPASARHRTQGASGCDLDELRLLDPASEAPVPPGTPGELCFRGPSSLRGYLGVVEANQSTFTTDGFVRTGDIMTSHEIEGRLYFSFEGRLRDNVNRGGEKIGCEEVEAFVSMHPSIADAKLVPMPDPFYGEKSCIYLVLRHDARPPSLQELVAFLVGKGLAKFKCPERIEVVDAFPVTRIGKVDKQAMRRLIADKLSAEQNLDAAS